jgi:hypothetical protein
MSRSVLVVALSMGALVLPVSRAAGAEECPSGVGRLGDSQITANVCVPGQVSANPGPSSSGVSSAGSSGGSGSDQESPYKWARTYDTEYSAATRTVTNAASSPGIQTLPSGAPTCPGPNGEDGRPYTDTLIDTRTGDVISSGRGCEVPGQAAVAVPRPLPPSPPSAAEVIEKAGLPRLQFGLSPRGKDCSMAGAIGVPAIPAPRCASGEAPGLTGLETLLWVDPAPPAEVTVTVDIRGYSVTSRARPVRYSWQMRQDGDTESSRNPNPAITTTTPGTQAAPAVRYRWETKGDYRMSLAVVWQGSYTFSGFGVASRTEPLGPVTGQPQTTPYHVIEVRSVPTAQTGP